jgi:hypothetical protein
VAVPAAGAEPANAEDCPPAADGAAPPLASGLPPDGTPATAARVGPALEFEALAPPPDALAETLTLGDSLAEDDAAVGDAAVAEAAGAEIEGDCTPPGAAGGADEPAPEAPAPDEVPFPAGGNVGGIPSTVEPGCGGRVGPPALWPGTALASCACVLQPVGVMTSLGLQM